MDRKQFLNSLGIGAALVLTSGCFSSCKKETTTPTGSIDFTLDLTAAANAALLNNGGYIVTNGCVVAKTTAGAYVAATVICSHEGKQQVTYDSTNNNWYCTAHGARFGLTGNGLNGNGSAGLTIYKTQLTGTTLRVYS